jgi:two-component system, NtrC family, sensor histidine kinase PilS
VNGDDRDDEVDSTQVRRRGFWRGKERRRSERRHVERRADDRESVADAESMFSVLVSADSQFDETANLSAGTSGLSDPTPGTRREGGAPSATAASAVAPAGARARWEDSDTLQRLYAKFVAARAIVGLLLVAALVVASLLGVPAPLPIVLIAIAYGAQTIVLWLLPRLRGPVVLGLRLTRRQWLATIGVDLAAFLLIHWLQPTHSFNFVILMLTPLLMGGALASRRASLAAAAAVVLMLLAATWREAAADRGGPLLWMQVGMVGAGFFAITLLAGEMAARLAREARVARSGIELARRQAQLNRLVIEEMSEGVLVVDKRLRVRAANPAARQLLVRQGLGRSAPFLLTSDPAWHELEALISTAFESNTWPGGDPKAILKFTDGVTRTLRVRARFTKRRAHADDITGEVDPEVLCVLFIEDMRTVQERSRQEKLAAMGRVSAGIAHEIRNPLSAIGQANGLLSEEVQGPEQRMLTRMISENVERLKMIVDDVMAVAPGREPMGQTIDAVTAVGRVVSEWSRAAGLPVGPQTRLDVLIDDASLPVRFDPEHLRRILVNLLDNARRYATDTPGAITLELKRHSPEHVMLSVASDGEPIGPDIEPYLFEPFFSTRSRGTGLGLYICRELCERYDATIDYWKHPPGSRHVNEFRVVLRSAQASELSESRLLP